MPAFDSFARSNALIVFRDEGGTTLPTQYLLKNHDAQSSDLLMILLYARAQNMYVIFTETGTYDSQGRGYIDSVQCNPYYQGG